jgi:ferric-dicitrate binding protein FerR (iron transport regulator)
MTRTATLTAKLLDGTLGEAEWAELELLLASDPAAEADHLALLGLEAELRGARADFDLTEATMAKVAESQAERTAGAVLARIAAASPPPWAAPAGPARPSPSGRRRRLALPWLLACAAALLLALWLDESSAPPPPPTGGEAPRAPAAFAKLASRAGSVELLSPTGEAIHAAEGGELPAGFTLRTVGDESTAVVELLRDNTRVEIEPDSVVQFAGGPPGAGKPRVFLAAGQLTAAVPQRPDNWPLVVGTAVASVLTRQGTFVLSSAGPGSARVDIKQGKVEVVRATARKPVKLGPGGAAVVFAGLDRLDVESALPVDRTPRRSLAFPAPRDVAFSPDGAEVWVANARLFERFPAEGRALQTVFYPRKGNDGLAAITADRKFLLAFRGDRDDSGDRVLVRTLPDGGEHRAIDARPSEPRFWAAAPDASWLAVVDPRPNNRRVRVLDCGTGEERFARAYDDAITFLRAAPDGAKLAVALHSTARGAGNKVVVLDASSGGRLFALSVLKRPCTALSFSPDGHYLAAGFNGTVQLWDLRRRELAHSITGFERAVTCLAFSPDGGRLAGGTPDGHVWLWDAASGRQTQLIAVGGRGVRALAFSPDGRQLAALANASPVTVWDVADRAPLADVQ